MRGQEVCLRDYSGKSTKLICSPLSHSFVDTVQVLLLMYQPSPAPVAQSVAFALPKTDCWEDLDRIPLRERDLIQVLTAVSFWKCERYQLSYRGWAMLVH